MKYLLLYLDSYVGTDPLGMFPLILKKTAEVLASHLAVVFQWLLRLGSFPFCWRVANVTLIPKGLPSSSASNYRPISFNMNTPRFLNVWCWFVMQHSFTSNCRKGRRSTTICTTTITYHHQFHHILPIQLLQSMWLRGRIFYWIDESRKEYPQKLSHTLIQVHSLLYQ